MKTKSLLPGRAIVIARSAEPPEPIDPNSTLGHSCVACGKPVQLSVFGLEQVVKKNGQPVCNPCGATISEILLEEMQKNSALMATFNFLPDAVAAIERITGKPALDLFPADRTRVEFI